jgi:hypothetical protein
VTPARRPRLIASAAALLLVVVAVSAVVVTRMRRVPLLADGQTVAFGRPAAEPYLGAGWGAGEGESRWTVGSRAEIVFRRSGRGPRLLDLTLHPFLPTEESRAQHVHVDVNGALSSALTLSDRGVRRYVVDLGAEAFRRSNVIGLGLPDARLPRGAGPLDGRALGIAVHSMALRPFPVLAPGHPVAWGLPEADPYLGNGWSMGEGQSRWNDGVTATLVFAAPRGMQGAVLALDWQPFYIDDASPQKVRVACNDTPLGEFVLEGPYRRRTPVRIPPATLEEGNVITLAFPTARSPASIGQSGDRRLLAVRLHAIEIGPLR